MNSFGDLLLLRDLAELLDSAPDDYIQREGSQGWVESTEQLEQAHLFRQEFRMNRQTFLHLVALVEEVEGEAPRLSRPRKHPVSSRVGMTVRYLSGASYWDLARIYKCHPRYVFTLINKTLPQIAAAYPLDSVYLNEVRDQAERTWAGSAAAEHMHGLFLAVDGYFLEHGPPTHGAMAYKTYKKSYATNVQAGADNDGRILWYSMRAAGGTHDSLALACSDLVALLRFERQLGQSLDATGQYIIGDDAYAGVSDYVVTPYKGRSLPPAQDAFNYYHSNARVCVERAFGMLETRWRVLRSPLVSRKPERWKAVWRACVALHNLCVDQACPRTRFAERRTRRFPHGPRERSAAGKRAAITKRLAEAGLQRPPHPQ